MEAEEVRVGRIAGLDGAGEGLRGLGVALELLVGEAEVDEEDAAVARALLVGGRRPGHDLLEQGRGSGEVAARLGDRDLEVGGLRVLGVGRRQRVGHGRGLVEAAEVPQRSPLEIEREQVRGVGDEHGLRFRESLLGALRLLEDLAEGEPHADVGGLDLEGLAVVEDRLVGVLGAGVDVPEDLVRAGRAGLKLQGRLEGRRGLVRIARHQEVGAPLDVRFEVAGVERQVHLPRARGLLVHLQLAVDPGEVQEGLAVGRPEPRDVLVLRGRAAQRLLRGGARGLDLLELSEDQVRVGVVRVEGDGGSRLLFRIVEAAHLAQQARGLDANRGRGGIELLGPPVLRERLVGVADETRLQAEAEVIVGLGPGGGGRPPASTPRARERRRESASASILPRAFERSQRTGS